MLKPNTQKIMIVLTCPYSLVKWVIPYIVKPLKHIFNNSLQKGVFPYSMKIARVIPIFKTGDVQEFSNYRPISILPQFSKILEKIFHSRLTSFLNDKQLLYEGQYGFRKKHFTSMAIFELVEEITTALDNSMSTVAVFIDLKREFDTVDHNILLNKLEHYGIRGLAFSWIQSYLTNRTQYAGLDIKLVDAVARGASRFENLLAPLKTYWPPKKLTGPFLGYISLHYQCIIVIIHRASCISCHSN